MAGGAGGLGAVTQMIAGQQDKFSDLGVSVQEMVERNQGKLAGALGAKGQFEQRAWEWNKAQPWQTKYGEAYGEGQAREGAGVQNIWSGISGVGNAATDMMLGSAMGEGGGKGGEGGMTLTDLLFQVKQIFGGGKEQPIATGM